MVETGDLVAIFRSIHRVMKSEKLLKAAGLGILLIPVPRQLTSDCGLAIRIPADQLAAVDACLAEAGIEILELHRCDGRGYTCLRG